jgi:catechol 2,3-dioxygenase-like lactoylglutathione lyase family enzyme
MQLINDINHLTFVTADMDRLISFYERIFNAETFFDKVEGNGAVRHAFIKLGPNSTLHPFEITGVNPPGEQPIFERGRLDHFALNATSEEAFHEMRRRLIAEGATTGEVTDMGAVWILTFSDPDLGQHEIAWEVPGTTYQDDGLLRENWTIVEMD